MMSPEEYERYHAFKAISEFGQVLDPAALKEQRKAKFRRWLPEVLAPYQTICDYGAGTGWLAELCEELGKSCTGVDDIGGGTRFTDVEPVDLVVAICVIEHMTPEQVVQFIRTSARKCRALLIVTNNPKCLFSHYVLWDDITHVRLYSEHSIGALLRSQDFEIDRIFYEDDVLQAYGITGERRADYERAAATLAPIFLGSPFNYWCMVARPPLAREG